MGRFTGQPPDYKMRTRRYMPENSNGGDSVAAKPSDGQQCENAPAEFEYFSHDADIGVVGRGPSPEAAMEAAARAMFAIMADPDTVGDDTRVRFAFDEEDLDLALVTWLNRLLAETRVAGIVPSRFRLRRVDNHWEGQCAGSPLPAGAERGPEVKGATLTLAAVELGAGGWEARCVVDV